MCPPSDALSVRFRTVRAVHTGAAPPPRRHFRKSRHLARLLLMVFLPLTGRHIMARFETIAFGFCASFAAILTIATLAPIA